MIRGATEQIRRPVRSLADVIGHGPGDGAFDPPGSPGLCRSRRPLWVSCTASQLGKANMVSRYEPVGPYAPESAIAEVDSPPSPCVAPVAVFEAPRAPRRVASPIEASHPTALTFRMSSSVAEVRAR